MDATGKPHATRVNGWRLKPYFSHVMEDQVEAETAQVSLNSDEPLGEIAQDPFIAQHVPCISVMSLGRPATRPCIDIVLCNPGTTSDPLVERMSAQAGCKEMMEMKLKDWSKRHECLLRLGEG